MSLEVLRAYHFRYKSTAAKSLQYFIDRGQTEDDDDRFSKLVPKDDDKQIPDIRIDGKDIDESLAGYYMIKVPVEKGGWREITTESGEKELIYLYNGWAAKAAGLGKESGCCQSISRQMGEPAAIAGINDPNCGFYFIAKGDINNPKLSDPLIGQSFVGRTIEKSILFNSIEAESYDPKVKAIRSKFNQHMHFRLVEEGHTDKVLIGAICGDAFSADVDDEPEKFATYDKYSNTQKQHTCYSKEKPYCLMLNKSEYIDEKLAKKALLLNIDKLLKSQKPLSSNTAFITMVKDFYNAKMSDQLPQYLQELGKPEAAKVAKAYISYQMTLNSYSLYDNYVRGARRVGFYDSYINELTKLISAYPDFAHTVFIDRDFNHVTAFKVAIARKNISLVRHIITLSTSISKSDTRLLTKEYPKEIETLLNRTDLNIDLEHLLYCTLRHAGEDKDLLKKIIDAGADVTSDKYNFIDAWHSANLSDETLMLLRKHGAIDHKHKALLNAANEFFDSIESSRTKEHTDHCIERVNKLIDHNKLSEELLREWTLRLLIHLDCLGSRYSRDGFKIDSVEKLMMLRLPFGSNELKDAVKQAREEYAPQKNSTIVELRLIPYLKKVVESNDKELLGKFIGAGANVHVRYDWDQKESKSSILHYAATSKADHAIFKVLIKQGVELNVQNQSGETPLFKIIENTDQDNLDKNLGIIKLLLEHGAAIDIKDRDGKTAMTRGEEMGLESVVKLLKKHTVNIKAKPTTGESFTALKSPRSRASFHKTPSITKALYENIKTHIENDDAYLLGQCLGEHRINLNEPLPDTLSPDNNTLLSLASEFYAPKCVSELLDRGAIVDPKNKSNKTPLLKCLEGLSQFFDLSDDTLQDTKEIVQSLISHGADPHHRDDNKMDAFDYARYEEGDLQDESSEDDLLFGSARDKENYFQEILDELSPKKERKQ